MTGKKVLITGSTGLVGSSITNQLLKERKSTLAVVSRDIAKTNLLFGKEVEHILYESENFKREIVEFSPDIVIHLAAYSTSQDDINSIKKLIDANILFLSILLDALKETKTELFLNTGTFAEYYYNDGELNPAYYYAATKTASRSILKYYKNIIGMKYCTVVPYTIYGGINKNKKIVDLLFDSLEVGVDKPISMSQGKQIFDFIHINDVVDFYLHIINKFSLLKDGENYHIGSGVGVTLREMAQVIEQVSEKKTNIAWGALEYRPTDVMRAIAPIYKLEKELAWIPKITLEKGISLVWSNKLSGGFHA